MKVFVVGANGFVGSHICRELLSGRHEITGFGPQMRVDLVADLAGRVAFLEGSAEDAGALDTALRAAAPDVVVWSAGHNANAAGLAATGETDSARSIAVNAGGLFNLLQAAQRQGIKRAVLTGSAVVFGPASFYRDTRIDESAPMQPTTAYGLSKAMGEQVAQYFRNRYGMDVTTLRLAVVFGPGRWYGGVVSQLNKLFEEAKTGARFDCKAPADTFDLVYVKDVAQAVRLAAEHRAALQPAYHVNSFASSYPLVIETLQRLVPDFLVSYEAIRSPLVFPLMRFDLIQHELGFKPTRNLMAAARDYLAHRPAA